MFMQMHKMNNPHTTLSLRVKELRDLLKVSCLVFCAFFCEFFLERWEDEFFLIGQSNVSYSGLEDGDVL